MNKDRFSKRFSSSCFILALSLAFLFLGFSAAGLSAENSRIQKANYELASKFTTQKMSKMVFDTSVSAHWLEHSDRFWYSYETSNGETFYLVDPARKIKTPVFDNAKMAAMLTKIVRIPYDAQHLPIKKLKFVKKDTAVQFEVEVPKDTEVATAKKEEKEKAVEKEKKEEKEKEKEKVEKEKAAEKEKEPPPKMKTLYFEYDLASGKLTLLEGYEAPPKKPRWASISPDEKTIVFARNYNLYMMDAASYALCLKKADDPNIVEQQLTTDGEEHYSYARTLSEEDKKELEKEQKGLKDLRLPAARVCWSKDSRKFAIVREDERKVADLWVINSLANPRPTLETYRYAMPGEVNVPQSEILIFDLETKNRVKVQADKFKDQSVSISTARSSFRSREREERPEPQWLSETPDKLYFSRTSRDLHKVDICLANSETGDARVLVEERLNTYVDTKPLSLVGNGKEVIHWSERDGWGHYYLYDGDGKLKNQITSGEFSCQGIEGVDEKNRILYFTACGREAGEDPYYMHLYRVNFDGTGLKLLSPEDSSHSVDMGESNKYFVDNFSKVNTAPRSLLRDSLGNTLVDLETTDLSLLLQAGYKFPEPFQVKADDGITDIYGVMYKPFDFDETKKYPIIAYVYPGPQTESVTKTFSPRSSNIALAQFGFIVIEVGNRGGHPLRSKWYHTYGYGNLRDYGLADKKAAIEQLAIRHPFVDIDRVGIYGHSGGGFMSTAAMLVYPEFFKVAVSSSGNHENNVYNKWWSEKHHGIKEVVDKDGNVKFEYSIDKNSEIAKNLKGHLLLATGDMDNNVHPANTLRLADALIKANKRFDFFIFPGKRHGYGDANDYFFWIRADYFCKYLIGDSADSVDLVELIREKEQGGEKRGRR
jgi:dipeptidyl aminopeptidase/acylaminoacyl peptidase